MPEVHPPRRTTGRRQTRTTGKRFLRDHDLFQESFDVSFALRAA